MRFLGLFYDFQRLQTQKWLKNEENSVQQAGAAYVAQGAPSADPCR